MIVLEICRPLLPEGGIINWASGVHCGANVPGNCFSKASDAVNNNAADTIRTDSILRSLNGLFVGSEELDDFFFLVKIDRSVYKPVKTVMIDAERCRNSIFFSKLQY